MLYFNFKSIFIPIHAMNSRVVEFLEGCVPVDYPSEGEFVEAMKTELMECPPIDYYYNERLINSKLKAKFANLFCFSLSFRNHHNHCNCH